MAIKSKGRLVPQSAAIPESLPSEITDIARMIQSGQVSAWSLEKRHNGVVKFHGTAPNGDGIIVEKKTAGGYSRTTTETMNKPATIAERRERVRELRGEGMTQTEIAKRTGYSQKTISNDCDALGI